MAKDHRPRKMAEFVHTDEGTFLQEPPPASNIVPSSPTKYHLSGKRRPKDEWTPEDEKKWKAYWEKIDSEYEAWDMHYKRQKWT